MREKLYKLKELIENMPGPDYAPDSEDYHYYTGMRKEAERIVEDLIAEHDRAIL